jgi:pyridoxal phosphate enzyme (YggS family)
MPTPRHVIADNLARVQHRIAEAAQRAGRAPTCVQLIAVTKYVDAALAAHLVEAGCVTLGESRPQQLWEKAAAPQLAGVQWHLIGRLQRNKIRRTLPLAQLIHSVDSERLLEAINEHAAELSLTPQVLLEVNCSGEANKQGFSVEEVCRLTPGLARFDRLRVAGLMTMASLEGDDSDARRAFATLRELKGKLASKAPPGVELRELSMGMSGDFEAAIAEGATMVRIGSSLFEGLLR